MKKSIELRKRTALSLLEAQLLKGTKPIKGVKPFKTDADGNFVYRKTSKGELILDSEGNKIPEKMEVYPLSPSDIAQKNKEVANLKKKLKIA